MKLGIYDLSYENFCISFTKVVEFAFDYLVDVKGVFNRLVLLFIGVPFHEPDIVHDSFFKNSILCLDLSCQRVFL